MNKYTGLSDFEINKKVADLIGATPYPTGLTEYHRSAVCGMENAIIIKSPRKVGAFDPCNNPADAMPIIIENKISLYALNLRDVWVAEYNNSGDDVNDGSNFDYFDSNNINPYRAAMEVFLLMKDLR